MFSESGRSLGEIAEATGGKLAGDAHRRVFGVATLHEAGPEEISFVSEPRWRSAAGRTKAAAVLVDESLGELPTPADKIFVADIEKALDIVLEMFAPRPDLPAPGADPTARIDPSARLAEGVRIGANVVIRPDVRVGERTVIMAGCYIGRQTVIGNDCLLYPGVVVRERSRIGDRVIIHPNTTIGSDGFGYRFENGIHVKRRHIGTVVVEDDVEIGAGCCIDRGKYGATVIGAGTKLDNLIQVAHNVQIGRGCVIAAQTGIAGSTTVGSYVAMGGKAGLRDHINVGDGVRIAACTCVAQDVPPKTELAGAPAIEGRKFLRSHSVFVKLPELLKQLKQLQARVKQLESAANDSK